MTHYLVVDGQVIGNHSNLRYITDFAEFYRKLKHKVDVRTKDLAPQDVKDRVHRLMITTGKTYKQAESEVVLGG